MLINIKKIFFPFLLAIVSVLFVFAIVEAATNMSPSEAPNPSVGTMKTLKDIYLRLFDGTVAGTHSLSPELGPTTGTMYTLDQIYDKIPTNDKVCSGTNGGTANCVVPLEWSPEVPGGGMDWNTAKAYCENPENGYLRLPTIEELISALTTNYFSGGDFVIDHAFWSSHEDYENTAAWYAYYASSVITASIANKDGGYSVRCVR